MSTVLNLSFFFFFFFSFFFNVNKNIRSQKIANNHLHALLLAAYTISRQIHICNLKWVEYLDLTGCSKIANLPENLGNMERLRWLRLGGTAIKELPSSTIHLKKVWTVSFKGCQLLSSSLTSMPIYFSIDLNDCNLSAIPSGIDRSSIYKLFLSGNDFISLPESISQFSRLSQLYFDGCKSLRSLSNIPSKISFICVDNCSSLEELPEPNDFYRSSFRNFTVQCFNCFKLASNIQNFSNVLVAELAPPHTQSTWGSTGEKVRAARLAAYYNYL